ncbi:MAG: hypothetical protein IMX03_03215 [Brockia lithotrophica]|nr:hypothetical protein [Brockia lithotrophica]
MERLLENNLFVRVLSVLLAFMLWLILRSETPPGGERVAVPPVTETIEREFRGLDIHPELHDPSVAILSIPTKADVVLRGPRVAVSGVLQESLRVVAPLQELGPGRHEVTLVLEGVPVGVEGKVVPERVEVVLEKVVEQEFPVSVEILGDAKPYVLDVQPDPSRVVVRGAESLVARVAIVKAFLTLDAVKPPEFTYTANLSAYDAQGKSLPVVLLPNQVKIRVGFAEAYGEVPLRPQIRGSPREGLAVADVSVTPQRVRILGSEQAVRGVSELVLPPVDVSGAQDSVSRSLQILLPAGVQRVVPQTATVTVRLVPAEERKLELPVETQDVPEGAEFRWGEGFDGKVVATIRGAPSVLDNLSPGSIRAYVSLAGVPADGAVHEVPVRVDLGNAMWVTAVQVVPDRIGVILTSGRTGASSSSNPTPVP